MPHGFCFSLSRAPARAVLLDDFVYFLHDTDGLAEGDNDFLVAGEVLQCEHAAGTRVLAASGLVVFLEPFFAHLIAEDLETPLDSNNFEVIYWSATSAWLRQLCGYLISGGLFLCGCNSPLEPTLFVKNLPCYGHMLLGEHALTGMPCA